MAGEDCIGVRGTMTHDRTKPPPDEIMAKVVGVWKGWGNAHVVYCYMLEDDAFCNREQHEYKQWLQDHVEEYRAEIQLDPRTNTDAALELLHHLVNLSPYGRLDCVLGGWDLSLADENDTRTFFPLSGEPFRTAVCWLAVDVLGVG